MPRVTDQAAFGWLCDVYIDPAHRRRGLGSRLAKYVVAHLEPVGLKRLILATADAHEVHTRVGFESHPEPWMLLHNAQPTTPV